MADLIPGNVTHIKNNKTKNIRYKLRQMTTTELSARNKLRQ
jgi:hypothetical protein